MRYKIKTPPAVEPLSLAETKMFLRLTDNAAYGDTAEDEYIAGLISAAREYCERHTRRALVTQTIEGYLDAFPRGAIEIPCPPLQSVTSVTYKTSGGVETTMTAGVDYIVDADSPVGRIVLPYGKTWPSFTAYTVNPIKITFVAGYTDVPRAVKQAMLLLIGHWYQNREATGATTSETEFAVTALLSQLRMRWWG